MADDVPTYCPGLELLGRRQAIPGCQRLDPGPGAHPGHPRRYGPGDLRALPECQWIPDDGRLLPTAGRCPATGDRSTHREREPGPGNHRADVLSGSRLGTTPGDEPDLQ